MRKPIVHLYAQDTDRTRKLVKALERAGNAVSISICPGRTKPLAVGENKQRAEGFRQIRLTHIGEV